VTDEGVPPGRSRPRVTGCMAALDAERFLQEQDYPVAEDAEQVAAE
jgi:hypothetical protein